jgi:hypothetical protein
VEGVRIMITPATTAENPAPPSADGTPSSDGSGVLLEILRTLEGARLPGLLGGPHALAQYTSLRQAQPRPIGAPEIYVKPGDQRKVLNALVHAGFRTEYVSPLSRARVSRGPADAANGVEVVYRSPNGLGDVDDDWFRFAVSADLAGYPVRMCPAEELLWHEAFVQGRVRHQGAAVARLILRQGRTFDWQRLLRRFHGHERVLLAHCVLFGYVYPTEQSCVPDWVLDYLNAAVRHEAQPHVKLCRGTLLAPEEYCAEIASHEFADGRLKPHGPLSAADLNLVSQSSCPDVDTSAPTAASTASSDGVGDEGE